jgi:N-acetylglucosaminyl-diphospho-decaprenol L-rhamnosyltransferase
VSRGSRAADGEPLVSVVVVTHNNRDLIDPCLRAIGSSVGDRAVEVIVVDNASTDGTRELIEDGTRDVELIALQENVGFAQGVNRAIATARGRYLALVNSDAFPDPGCLQELVEFLEAHPRVGIVGAKLRYPSGRLQPSAGTFPSLRGGLWVALSLHRVPGLSRLGIGYLADPRLYRRARRVDWVCAATCAARAQLGEMPSGSFMYGEDVEWARACQQLGFEVWLVPDATSVHISRASVDQSRDDGFAQRRRAQFELAWFARRGPLAVLLARGVLLLHGSVRLAVYGALAIVRGRRDRRVAEYGALVRAAVDTPAPIG